MSVARVFCIKPGGNKSDAPGGFVTILISGVRVREERMLEGMGWGEGG